MEELGGGTDLTGPARTVEEHIQKLNVTQILSGWKPGQFRRWAMTFKENCSLADGDVLQAHLDAVDAALALHRGAIAKLDMPKLEKCLDTLIYQSVDFPTAVKLELVERHLVLWQNRPDRFSKVSAMLEMIKPWYELPDEEDDVAEPPSFNPKVPTMCAIEGSAVEKCKRFRETLVKDILAPTLRQGGEAAQSTQELCVAVLEHLHNIGSIDDNYGETVHELLIIFRCVLSIFRCTYVEGCGHVEMEALMGSAGIKSTKNMKSVVASTILQTPYLETQRAMLAKYATSTKLHKPAICTALKDLVVAGDKNTAAAIANGFAVLSRAAEKVAPGTCDELDELLKIRVASWVAETLTAVEGEGSASVDLQVAGDILSSAMALWGPDQERNELMHAVRKSQETADNMGKLRSLEEACQNALLTLEASGPSFVSFDCDSLHSDAAKVEGLHDVATSDVVKKFVQALASALVATAAVDLPRAKAGVDLLERLVSWSDEVSLDEGACRAERLQRALSSACGMLTHARGVEKSLAAGTAVCDKSFLELKVILKKGVADFACFGDAPLRSRIINPAVNECESTIEVAKKRRVDIVAVEATDIIKGGLANLAGGMNDGSHWADGFAGIDFKALYLHAGETLLKAPGSKIKRMVDELDEALERFQNMCDMHEEPLELDKAPEWYREALLIAKRARATVIEAVALEVLSKHHGNPVKLKALVKTQIAQADRKSCSGNINGIVRANMAKALEFTFTWPSFA